MGGPGDAATLGSAGGLGGGAIRDLAARHGVRPTKALGQHFLIDPNLARAIVADAGVGAGDRVVEVGAGLGSLTLALADAGAEVLAVEVDRGMIAALAEVVVGRPQVRVVHADAMRLDWAATLGGDEWVLCANLPYNLATPLVLELLAGVPAIRRFVVMVQREVGERLIARPGGVGYGAVSVRVAYRAEGALVRRVPPEVFWPRPTVESIIVRLDRREAPPVEADETVLWSVLDAGFAERRKTMRNALRRMGFSLEEAGEVLATCGVSPTARAEELDLATFACLARGLPGRADPAAGGAR